MQHLSLCLNRRITKRNCRGYLSGGLGTPNLGKKKKTPNKIKLPPMGVVCCGTAAETEKTFAATQQADTGDKQTTLNPLVGAPNRRTESSSPKMSPPSTVTTSLEKASSSSPKVQAQQQPTACTADPFIIITTTSPEEGSKSRLGPGKLHQPPEKKKKRRHNNDNNSSSSAAAAASPPPATVNFIPSTAEDWARVELSLRELQREAAELDRQEKERREEMENDRRRRQLKFLTAMATPSTASAPATTSSPSALLEQKISEEAAVSSPTGQQIHHNENSSGRPPHSNAAVLPSSVSSGNSMSQTTTTTTTNSGAEDHTRRSLTLTRRSTLDSSGFDQLHSDGDDDDDETEAKEQGTDLGKPVMSPTDGSQGSFELKVPTSGKPLPRMATKGPPSSSAGTPQPEKPAFTPLSFGSYEERLAAMRREQEGHQPENATPESTKPPAPEVPGCASSPLPRLATKGPPSSSAGTPQPEKPAFTPLSFGSYEERLAAMRREQKGDNGDERCEEATIQGVNRAPHPPLIPKTSISRP